jgi:hypothetical protein
MVTFLPPGLLNSGESTWTSNEWYIFYLCSFVTFVCSCYLFMLFVYVICLCM